MSKLKKPMAEANHVSSMLNLVLGIDRFPVKVNEVALEYSRHCFADSPVDKVQGEDLDGFEGMLAANKARSKWLIVYNSSISSDGRKRFSRTGLSAETMISRPATATNGISKKMLTCSRRPS